jgi:hypothetical protein
MGRGIAGSGLRSRLAVLGTALALVACAPAVRLPLYTSLESTGSFGYAERQLAERRFLVSYDAPVVATYAYPGGQRQQEVEQEVALAYDMALWRAAELALAAGYPALTVAERDREVRVEVFGDPYYDPFASPFYPFFYPPFPFTHHGPLYGHLPHPFYYGYQEPYAELIVGVAITVEFIESVGPGALDARATLDRLRAQYPDAVPPPPPS